MDREPYKEHLMSSGLSEEKAQTQLEILSAVEKDLSISIDKYLPYGRQYMRYRKLYDILSKEQWVTDEVFAAIDRYKRYCLEVNQIQRDLYKISRYENGRYYLWSYDTEYSGWVHIEFYHMDPPPLGSLLFLPEEMLTTEEDGCPFSNTWLALGPPDERLTVPEGYNIEYDYALLEIDKEITVLQRYYG